VILRSDIHFANTCPKDLGGSDNWSPMARWDLAKAGKMRGE
jgi:hypothetical protein